MMDTDLNVMQTLYKAKREEIKEILKGMTVSQATEVLRIVMDAFADWAVIN